MADLSTESIERLADARREAESELKRTLSGVRESDDVADYLPAFTSFACALFDAEAGELLKIVRAALSTMAELHQLAPMLRARLMALHSCKSGNELAVIGILAARRAALP